nr:acylphosphatase [Solidesulfovibrio sp.]
MSQNVRCRHIVAGQVQGVGFRPFVYRLASELQLGGSVRNTPEGVVIEVEGAPGAVAAFGERLPAEIPPLARLTRHERAPLPPLGETVFRIGESAAGAGHDVLISPDVATCPDCLADMADPANRRYRYPFTNCTNCGPRHTITRAIPYDRATTSMACFPLCPDCAAEYADPADRRFHAEPVACPVCGPRVWLADAAGMRLAADDA